ncbi:MAG: L-asparaginase [Rhodocyclales bacterium]|nr:L-asparaginase [Rhodocyclales bacterium]
MKRILLLYTGGTIGCEGTPLAPMSAERFKHCLTALALMPQDVVCELQALPQPLDSATMQPGDWLDITASLLDAWASFDGFVVLHGTDTLAYTAAALSFLLQGADKPVVFTGSQYPLSAVQSDAPRNIADAIVAAAAAAPGLTEVSVCFAGRLLRGNRCIKRSVTEPDAFASPNWPQLGEVADHIVVLNASALLPQPVKPFDSQAVRAGLQQVRERLSDYPVWAIQLHPGFPPALLRAALTLHAAPRAWVLACYGSGNAPEDADFIAALHEARARGVVVVAVTQAAHGGVDLTTYRTGAGLAQAGVISGRDMTLPAALTKLQLLLAQGLSQDEVITRLSQPLAGEMSPG